MALDAAVIEANVLDLEEYSDKRQVRKKLVQSAQIVCEMVYYEPGQETVFHHHPTQDEIFYTISGTGAITFEDKEIPVKAGSVVFVPSGIVHGIRTDSDNRLVLMFTKGPGVTGPTGRKAHAEAIALAEAEMAEAGE